MLGMDMLGLFFVEELFGDLADLRDDRPRRFFRALGSTERITRFLYSPERSPDIPSGSIYEKYSHIVSLVFSINILPDGMSETMWEYVSCVRVGITWSFCSFHRILDKVETICDILGAFFIADVWTGPTVKAESSEVGCGYFEGQGILW